MTAISALRALALSPLATSSARLPSVRAAAAKTLAEFPHEADEEFLRRALPQEASERVRRDLLAGLSRRERFDDGARDLVDWIAGNDPSGDIREYAENLLR